MKFTHLSAPSSTLPSCLLSVINGDRIDKISRNMYFINVDKLFRTNILT